MKTLLCCDSGKLVDALFVFLALVMNPSDTFETRRTTVAQWLRCCATNRKVAGSIPAGVSGFFVDIKFFRSHYGPGVDSASSRNKYQEHIRWIKVARA